MTLGDAHLGAEILRLFATQSLELRRDIAAASDGAAAAAHTLKGSAGAVGAFALERAVTAYEEAAAARADMVAVIVEIDRSVADVTLAIETYLAKHPSSSAGEASAAGVGSFEPL